jgi:hypothetical protein
MTDHDCAQLVFENVVLRAEVDRLRHALTNVADNLHGAGLISDVAKANILAASAGSATPTEPGEYAPEPFTTDEMIEIRAELADPDPDAGDSYWLVVAERLLATLDSAAGSATSTVSHYDIEVCRAHGVPRQTLERLEAVAGPATPTEDT